jgi:hypothetical protein
MVYPGTGGMSASPDSVYNLGVRQRPPQLGGQGKDPVWCISRCDLGPDLQFNQNSPNHGLIEPAYPMPLEQYQKALAETRKFWRLFFDPSSR